MRSAESLLRRAGVQPKPFAVVGIATGQASATAAAEALVPAGWLLALKEKGNGQWAAVCSKGTLYTTGTSKNKALAIASAALKAVKLKTGKA